MALAAGDRLGPYVLEAPIGSGGMGDVYRARDTRLDRTVAIKTVSGAFGDRFEREARAISALNHPHICTLHDVGRDGDTAFLVMELVGGTHPHRPLPVDKTIRYGIEVCSALEAAHKAGIVPRDLKPANIIVTRQGVKLLDFGLAKVQASVTSPTDGATAPVITAAHTVLGTLQYMSPEQVEGREADTRSDIFALGCVLYEFLTGTPAFGGKSSSAIMGHSREGTDADSTRAPDRPARARAAHVTVPGQGSRRPISERARRAAAARVDSRSRRTCANAGGARLAARMADRRCRRTRAGGGRVHLGLLASPRTIASASQRGAESSAGISARRGECGAGAVARWPTIGDRCIRTDEQSAIVESDAWRRSAAAARRYRRRHLSVLVARREVARILRRAHAEGRGARLGQRANGRGRAERARSGVEHRRHHRVLPGRPGGIVSRACGRWRPTTADDAGERRVASVAAVAAWSPPRVVLRVQGRCTARRRFLVRSNYRKDATGREGAVGGAVRRARPDPVPARADAGGAAIRRQRGANDRRSRRRRGECGELSGARNRALLSHRVRRDRLSTTDGSGAAAAADDLPSGWDEDRRARRTGADRRAGVRLRRRPACGDAGGRRQRRGCDGLGVRPGHRCANADQIRDGRHRVVARRQAPGVFPKRRRRHSAGRFLRAARSVMERRDSTVDGQLLDWRRAIARVQSTGDQRPRSRPAPAVGRAEAGADCEHARVGDQRDVCPRRWRARLHLEPDRPVRHLRLAVSLVWEHAAGDRWRRPASQWINGGRELAYLNDDHKLFAAEILRAGDQLMLGRTRALFGGNPLPTLPGSEGDREGEAPVYLTPDGTKIVLAVPTDLDAVVPLTLITNWR